MYGPIRILLSICFLLLVTFLVRAEDVGREQIKGLDEQVQDIKKDVIDLTAELSLLEEKLLFPSNSQVSVFVSIMEDDDFRLDAVQMKMDNKVVAHHLYTFRELEALHRGGVQRVYTGNVKTGDHELVVSIVGQAPAGGEFRRSASYTLTKDVGPKFVQVIISGPGGGDQEIRFKDW
jgi:hypothetical protein